jgi:divalent metal cation (Fe/Co/Zn/Cd) transporter
MVEAAVRLPLERRARALAWLGLAWHAAEFVVAVVAGVAAGSIALIGFGVDSLIEALAGLVVLWLFTGRRLASATAERRAQQLVALSFFVLAAYVAVESVRTLVAADRPEVSWVGIGLAAVTLVVMPPLAVAKRRVGRSLGSAATVQEAEQTQLCAYLSVALLVGLGANALAGWWWADPLAALVIAAVATHEGVESWRGDACCDTC